MNLQLDGHMQPAAPSTGLECILGNKKHSGPLTSAGGEGMHNYDRYCLEILTSYLVCLSRNTLCPETAQRRSASLRGGF